MTEKELREKYVGETIGRRSAKWEIKKKAYKQMGVWGDYVTWDRYYRGECSDATGYINIDMKRQATQHKIDTFLIRQSHGEDITMPVPQAKPVLEKKKEKNPVDPLMDLDDFTDTGSETVDMVETITYVFQNMNLKDVDPKDAPSRGAYFYLMRIRNDPTAKNEFYKGGLMKLVPSSAQLKEIGKKNDDGRETFELLDRLLQECADSQRQVPIL